jgi:hypothetical protein
LKPYFYHIKKPLVRFVHRKDTSIYYKTAKTMTDLTWKTEKRKVSDLLKSEINPRKIKPEKLKALEDSLNKFNLAEIPVINTDNTLITGNQRVTVLGMIGRKNEKIDVRVPSRPLTEQEAKEYMLIGNTHAGEFDGELIDLYFDDIVIDFDMNITIDQEEESSNIGLLSGSELNNEIDKFKTGIRKAIQIEFEPSDYEEAQNLVKYCRQKNLYIGKYLIDKLKDIKQKNDLLHT